jgi:glycosyltransferase involved in cell wall biosynthesis
MRPDLPSIAVVIPAYRVAALIGDVISRIPSRVSHIVVVDDASPDGLSGVLSAIRDPRVSVVRHDHNRGVGGAMKSGFERALELGANIVVKVDADGQMDPALLPHFLASIERGDADIAKGNRFDDLRVISRMPLTRRIGNLALSFLVKLASGYWRTFDPCNGYIAIRSDVLRRLDMSRIDDRFFFEISLLCEAYTLRARVCDVPMTPTYGNETSSLNPIGVIPNFSMRLIQRALRRIFITYFMRDFNVVSLFLLIGTPALLFGVAWSVLHWIQSARTEVFASTGTIMIGVLSIVLGFQLVLQAIVLDVENEPGRSRQ